MPVENSKEHLETCSGRLADYLQSHKEKFIARWVAEVRKDSGVPSDSLTKPEIIDHVPMIFDAITHALREHGTEAKAEQVQKIAARHTIIRWAQGYNLQAVLREISLLRAEFVAYLRAFEDEQQCFNDDVHRSTSMTIQRILDGIVMDAIDTFIELKTRADADKV